MKTTNKGMKSLNDKLWNEIQIEDMEVRDEFGCWCQSGGCVDWCFSCICFECICFGLC